MSQSRVGSRPMPEQTWPGSPSDRGRARGDVFLEPPARGPLHHRRRDPRKDDARSQQRQQEASDSFHRLLQSPGQMPSMATARRYHESGSPEPARRCPPIRQGAAILLAQEPNSGHSAAQLSLSSPKAKCAGTAWLHV